VIKRSFSVTPSDFLQDILSSLSNNEFMMNFKTMFWKIIGWKIKWKNERFLLGFSL
jgi:hypothetical protein